MEFVGVRPLLVKGSSANIKVTHSSDLAIAEALLTRKELSS
jgi:2-C-methyl-D-erythritol 4-phosphate cytidylyltransferase